MAKSAKTQAPVPTLKSWGEVDQRPFYKGVEVAKANKTTVHAKDGATPLFKYVNKNGVVGTWYDIKDVIKVDKTIQADNKRFANDLHKKLKSGEIDAEQMKEVLTALGLA